MRAGSRDRFVVVRTAAAPHCRDSATDWSVHPDCRAAMKRPFSGLGEMLLFLQNPRSPRFRKFWFKRCPEPTPIPSCRPRWDRPHWCEDISCRYSVVSPRPAWQQRFSGPDPPQVATDGKPEQHRLPAAPSRCFRTCSASSSARISLTTLTMPSRSSVQTTLPLRTVLAQRCLQGLAGALGCPDEWVSIGAGNTCCYSRTANVADAIASRIPLHARIGPLRSTSLPSLDNVAASTQRHAPRQGGPIH